MATNRNAETGLIWLALILFWPLLGWLGDRPNNVHEDESSFASAGQWTSAIFHSVGAILAALIYPLWGLGWAAFAGLVMARRLAARHVVPIRFRDLKRGLLGVSYGTNILGAAAIFAILAQRFADQVPGLELLASVCVIAGYVVIVMAGIKFRDDRLRYRYNYEKWAPVIASVFGLSRSVIDGDPEANVTVTGDGTVVLEPVPPQIRAKMSTDNFIALDAAVAQQDPDYMFDPDSDHSAVILRPVDDATLERRGSLAASHGIATGGMGIGIHVDLQPQQSRPKKNLDLTNFDFS